MKISNNSHTVEFFHDVICSFCFPMSYHMRVLAQNRPELNIIHRSFALMPSEDSFTAMFGTREQAKPEVLTHWAQANRIDPARRFNIEGMKKTDFLFPGSMRPLRAAKAAGLMGGQALYWDVFDRLQTALFVENQNIDDDAVLADILRPMPLDFTRWQELYQSDASLQAVQEDLELAQQYGVHSAPTLIIDREYSLRGARSSEDLQQLFDSLAD